MNADRVREATEPAEDEVKMKALRADIARTRSELGETIEALQERLSPGRLAGDAKHAVREATVGRAEHAVESARDSARGVGEQMMDTIRRNPVPATVAAVGIGWLLMKSRNEPHGNGNGLSSGDYSRGGYSSYYGEYDAGRMREDDAEDRWRMGEADSEREGLTGRASGMVSGVMSTASERASGVADSVSGAAGQASDTVSDAAARAGAVVGDAAGMARERASQLAGGAGDMAGRAREMAGHGMYEAQHKAQDLGSQLRRAMRDQPLVVGGIATAVGAMVGFALPETEQERNLMGGTRDRLMDQAKETVQETQQKLQSVAEDAKDKIREAAEEQQLLSS
jgi:hypothetical protein